MSKKHRVVAIAYNNLCLFEFGIATEIFALPRPELGLDWYNFRVCSVEQADMEALGGVKISVKSSLRLLDTADTIVIPGWNSAATSPQLIAKLLKANQRGARIVSICSGAFLIGQAGLLEGRQATTHWRHVDALQEQFPCAQVVPDVLYVEDGGIFTSAGSAAGIDLCLHIVRSDYGSAVANSVARRLVLPAHRSGGQAQFIAKPMVKERASLSPLLDWIIKNLPKALNMASLASQANCSERHLLRRFKAETGCSPMRWVTEQRTNLAKDLLETSNAPLSQVAEKSGFNTVETLRHHFRSIVGVAPMEYRRSFNSIHD